MVRDEPWENRPTRLPRPAQEKIRVRVYIWSGDCEVALNPWYSAAPCHLGDYDIGRRALVGGMNGIEADKSNRQHQAPEYMEWTGYHSKLMVYTLCVACTERGERCIYCWHVWEYHREGGREERRRGGVLISCDANRGDIGDIDREWSLSLSWQHISSHTYAIIMYLMGGGIVWFFSYRLIIRSFSCILLVQRKSVRERHTCGHWREREREKKVCVGEQGI